jgi:tripartite-type tricarboxylate transporter receptor subunit TctC
VIVPANAGGGTDLFARRVAEYLGRATGKNFIILNVPEGSGMVGFEQTRNATPDGNTIMFWHAGFYVTAASGQYEFQPNKDFTPIAMFNGIGDDGKQVFVVNGKSEWNTLSDLVEAAKVNPGQITYGCSTGGSAQLVAEMLMQATGCELRIVDAASQTDKITGVGGGNIDVSAITLSAALQYVESGDLKILGVVDKEGTADYKSAYEQGYENCYWTQNLCVYGPAGLDEDITKAISAVLTAGNDDETLKAGLTESKMLNVALDYDASMAAFEDYEKLVNEIAANVDWGF